MKSVKARTLRPYFRIVRVPRTVVGGPIAGAVTAWPQALFSASRGVRTGYCFRRYTGDPNDLPVILKDTLVPRIRQIDPCVPQTRI